MSKAGLYGLKRRMWFFESFLLGMIVIGMFSLHVLKTIVYILTGAYNPELNTPAEV